MGALTLAWGLLSGPVAATLDRPAPPDHERAEAWSSHQDRLSKGRFGFVVWESNRTGSWRLFSRQLDGTGLRQLSADEPGREHGAPHISPDGRHLVYLAFPAPFQNFEQFEVKGKTTELRLLRLEDGVERVLSPAARSYGQNRGAVWVDNRTVVYVDGKTATRVVDIETGESSPLGEPTGRRNGYLVNRSHTHATTTRPTFALFDPEQGTIIERRSRDGCQPYFSHDGRYAFWVSGSGGPFQSLDLSTGKTEVMLPRRSDWLPQGHRYVYYPMVSNTQGLLAFGASRNEHGHFEADFDVFVAPIDPDTLELTGTPVRYSFDGGQDRFPDVYERGAELGRHSGEAPLEIELAGYLPPGSEATIDYGDGSASGSATSHAYREPGSYALVARVGGQTLRGRVVVREPVLPELRRLEVRDEGRRLVLAYNRPVDVKGVEASLASGAAVRSVKRSRRGRQIDVVLAEPLAERDELHLPGISDGFGHPLAEATFIVAPSNEWPSDTEGIRFLFATRQDDNLVPDPDGGPDRAFPLMAAGRARPGGHGTLEVYGGGYLAEGAGAEVARAAAASGEFTIELTFFPKKPKRADGDVLVLGDSRGAALRITRKRAEALLSLRDSEGVEGRARKISRVKGGGTNHLLLTYRDGTLRVYHNGSMSFEENLEPDLAGLGDDAELWLGSGMGGRGGFTGTIEGVAIYDRAMGAEEAAAHHSSYSARIAEREPIPRIKVRAKEIARSKPPTLDQIAPYRDALVVHEYEVLQGSMKGQTVRVAHWALLDGQAQPVANVSRGKRKARLSLELLDQHPEIASRYIADSLPIDPDVPVYLDVSS